MTLPVEPVPVVVIIWKCSVPDTAARAPVGAADAVIAPETAMAATVTTAPAPPIKRLRCFSMVIPPDPRGAGAAAPSLVRHHPRPEPSCSLQPGSAAPQTAPTSR